MKKFIDRLRELTVDKQKPRTYDPEKSPFVLEAKIAMEKAARDGLTYIMLDTLRFTPSTRDYEYFEKMGFEVKRQGDQDGYFWIGMISWR